jgi:hypothetical protein
MRWRGIKIWARRSRRNLGQFASRVSGGRPSRPKSGREASIAQPGQPHDHLAAAHRRHRGAGIVEPLRRDVRSPRWLALPCTAASPRSGGMTLAGLLVPRRDEPVPCDWDAASHTALAPRLCCAPWGGTTAPASPTCADLCSTRGAAAGSCPGALSGLPRSVARRGPRRDPPGRRRGLLPLREAPDRTRDRARPARRGAATWR